MPTVPARTVYTALAACAAAVLLGACGARHNAAEATAALSACRLDGVARELRCGQLQVPENPDRADGRKIHDMLLVEVKKPEESKAPWDYYKIRATIPAEEAFRPMDQGGCPMIKK